MEKYRYIGDYRKIVIKEELNKEGVLIGDYGTLKFRRCDDGLAIYDSCFPGSGFVSCPTSANIGVPDFINNIPVTELHKDISISSSSPIAIEGGELKRVYLKFEEESIEDEIKRKDYDTNPLAALFLIMRRDKENSKRKDDFLDISIIFCNSSNSVELCEIQCSHECVLHTINTKYLIVNAPITILQGAISPMLERVEFSGKVYPFVCSDWDGEYINNDYFEGSSKLRFVNGSLSGDVCWNFKNCRSLESVHLANGITKLPPYAFFNCKSLKDLYIPDSVTEIGEYAFAECENLMSIHLPDCIHVIPKGAFKNCSSLLKCYIPDSIEIIENEAFCGCTALRKPWIPKSIKEIGETAFDNPTWRNY